MALNTNAIIDTDYYNLMRSSTIVADSDEEIKLHNIINAISSMFESFCNRRLKSREYSYLIADATYDFSYSIFNGPSGSYFWFPTYPINSITTFIIGTETITPATSYDLDDGYHLYPSKGLLVYNSGFDYGYLNNVFVKWDGGYAASSVEWSELQFLCFETIKTILNTEDVNKNFFAEKMGNYSYTQFPNYALNQIRALTPEVFQGLLRFRKEAFA
jgi:hypothetical protein